MGRDKRNTAVFTAFDDYDQPELATPEKNLLRAVLLNAIADMNRPGEYGRRAEDYFSSREEDYVFSFHSVCWFLKINPEHILMLVGLAEGPASATDVDRSVLDLIQLDSTNSTSH